MQAFLFLSTVCPVYFTDFLSSPLILSSFSLALAGSAVIVYGTSIVTNDTGTLDLTWECFIDNTSIGSSLPPALIDGSQNNWILCGGGSGLFQDGPHLLTVNANVSNQQTFWFDQIQYAPSASVSLNQSLLRIDSSDSAIQYSPGWTFMEQPITYNSLEGWNYSLTSTTGATFTYQFSGS
jgi:hypothetical protein